MPQNLDSKISQFIKDEKCFNYKGKGHIMLNCLKKTKVSTNINISDIDNIENID